MWRSMKKMWHSFGRARSAATEEADDWLNSAMRGYLRHRRRGSPMKWTVVKSLVASLVKSFLPRTVPGGKNYAPVTLLERNAVMTRRLIILTLPTCEFLMSCPSKPECNGLKGEGKGRRLRSFLYVQISLLVPETLPESEMIQDCFWGFHRF